MKTLLPNRKIALLVAIAIIAFVGVFLSLRNRLSEPALVGHWQGQSNLGDLYLDFRPDGTVIRNNHTKANYHVQGDQVIFTNIESASAPKRPVFFQCALVGDTLTIGTDQRQPVAVLKRAM